MVVRVDRFVERRADLGRRTDARGAGGREVRDHPRRREIRTRRGVEHDVHEVALRLERLRREH